MQRLSAGGLLYSIDDDDGWVEDILLAKASQKLKYVTVLAFVESMDKLNFLPLNSRSLCKLIKDHGINIRYIGTIYKLTSLPYLR